MARVFKNDKREIIMRLLMIVGSADSIFIYNMAKWLKETMDITIDVYELEPIEKKIYDNRFYDSRNTGKYPSPNDKILYATSEKVRPFIRSFQLKSFLKGKYYDIIHIHWITSPVVLSVFLKKHCRSLCVTFWGGELTNMRIFRSHVLYRFCLKSFMREVDYVVNSGLFKSELAKFPVKRFCCATLGSSSIEFLMKLMKTETKETAKIKLGMPKDKTIVMIGYSGKALHQHLLVIDSLSKNGMLKNKIHLFVPMTRDANPLYTAKVEKALVDSGFTYTLLKDRYLSDEEVALTRLATDVIFQFSTFDGFSRSIIESMCAKGLLLYADWLNYSERLKEFEFYAIPASSINEGVERLESVIANMNNYYDLLEQNSENGKMKLLWSECIKDWINLYNRILCGVS